MLKSVVNNISRGIISTMTLQRIILSKYSSIIIMFFFFQAEDGIRDGTVTGVQTCALPILVGPEPHSAREYHGGTRVFAGAVLHVLLLEVCSSFRQPLKRQCVRAGPGMSDGLKYCALTHKGTRSEERRVGKECRTRSSEQQR